jgi:glycosidase
VLLCAQSVHGRIVSFRYQPAQALKSVVVVGQFNNWDRARHPLVLQKDGKTWEGSFEIPVGVYQYLFCEDGQRWVPDPGAPKVSDANGNVNSKLVVAPESYDALPGARGDGKVTMSAVVHRPLPADSARIDQRTAWVRLRTRASDVSRIWVEANGKRGLMKRVDGDELVDVWQGTIYFGRVATRYRFWLDDSPAEPIKTPSYSQEFGRFPLPHPPAWVQDAVFYQIFPERFANGDPSNDGPGLMPWGTMPTPQTWQMRVGGDLAGIKGRLNHLRELGVSGIYLNPVFQALHNHAYDTDDYMNVDRRFGTNDELKGLVCEAHRGGMRVILDGVFNHSSPEFFAFRDVRANGLRSKFKDWFFISGEPVVVEEGQKTYRTFAGVPTMPKLNQDNPEARSYFLNVGTHWIKQAGIDGWRLDVADEVSQDFWRRFRTDVKRAKKDAYIVGEVWGDAHEYLQGDQHDAVMNYRWRKAVLDFVAYRTTSPRQFDTALRRIREDYPSATQTSMFNLLGSHDTERLRTVMKGDRERERLAILLQFTYPGVPSVYYGDEIGMEGGKEPLSRGPMVWDRTKWDTGLFEFYKQMVRLRRDNPALRRGTYKTLVADDAKGVFAYERSYGKNRVIVALNNSSRVAEIMGLRIEPAGFRVRTDRD